MAKYITLWVSEVPQDIANKLNNQQIKLDPTVWVGRNLANYQQQLNQTLVTEKILNKYEAPYVYWSNFTVCVAKYFWSWSFNVYQKDPQYGAKVIVSLDASTGEKTKAIATKIKKADIKLNLNFWKNKTVTNYIPLMRSILVNEKILTKASVWDSDNTILKRQSQTSNSGNLNFARNLKTAVMQSKGYLTLYFWWEYQTKHTTKVYTTIGYDWF